MLIAGVGPRGTHGKLLTGIARGERRFNKGRVAARIVRNDHHIFGKQSFEITERLVNNVTNNLCCPGIGGDVMNGERLFV